MISIQKKEHGYRSIDKFYIGIPQDGCCSCLKQLHTDIKVHQHDDKIKYKHNLNVNFKISQICDAVISTQWATTLWKRCLSIPG